MADHPALHHEHRAPRRAARAHEPTGVRRPLPAAAAHAPLLRARRGGYRALSPATAFLSS